MRKSTGDMGRQAGRQEGRQAVRKSTGDMGRKAGRQAGALGEQEHMTPGAREGQAPPLPPPSQEQPSRRVAHAAQPYLQTMLAAEGGRVSP